MQKPMMKARDGATDLYGLLYTPTNLDTAKKYPIVNHIYPGPQTGSVSGRGFKPARGDAQPRAAAPVVARAKVLPVLFPIARKPGVGFLAQFEQMEGVE